MLVNIPVPWILWVRQFLGKKTGFKEDGMKNLFVPWFCEKGVSLHHPLGFNLAPKLEGAGKNMFYIYIYKHIYTPPEKLNMEPKKWRFGICLSFSDMWFSASTLVFGGVYLGSRQISEPSTVWNFGFWVVLTQCGFTVATELLSWNCRALLLMAEILHHLGCINLVNE